MNNENAARKELTYEETLELCRELEQNSDPEWNPMASPKAAIQFAAKHRIDISFKHDQFGNLYAWGTHIGTGAFKVKYSEGDEVKGMVAAICKTGAQAALMNRFRKERQEKYVDNINSLGKIAAEKKTKRGKK